MSITYGGQIDVVSASYGSLSVIVPMLERMQVEEIIDQHLPADPQAEFGHGRILSLLAAARLYSPVALMNVPEWAASSGADIVFGIPFEKMNDDRLGRSLDQFFGQRHSILSSIALHVSKEFGIPLREIHYDPTHILFTGAYEDAVLRQGVVVKEGDAAGTILSDNLLEPAHITKGRAMEDAPKGSKMIHAGLCVQVDEYGPLPIYGHTVDGNQNGRHAVHEQFELLRKHLPSLKLTMISDRGTYSVGHLLRLKDSGCAAICSAPWGEFSAFFDEKFHSLSWNKATYLSIEQQRRRIQHSDLPHEEYKLAVVRHTLRDEQTGRELACRVIFVDSSADRKVVRHQRQKQIDRITTEFQKIQAGVAAGRAFSDEAAVSRRVARVLGTASAAKYFAYQMIPLTGQELKELPPLGRGCRRPTHRFTFTFHEAQLRIDEKYDGYNAIVATAQRKDSADALFTRFKQQAYSEQVNARFKGPLAVRPVFLHKPERVEALVFLMMIALTLHVLIQRTYRSNLPSNATVKQRRTTTLTLLKAFDNYALLIENNRFHQIVRPTKLTPRQREILLLLDLPTPAQFLSRLLPRPPT
jgi:transposase